MKKLLALQLVILFICVNLLSVYAQDSVAKHKPQTLKPVSAAPRAVYKPTYYKKPGDTASHVYYHTAATDSARNAALKAALTTDKTLNGQYQYLLTKVYLYQQPLLNAFHKNIMDTLSQARAALKPVQAKLAAEIKLADSLQNSIKVANQTLSEASNRDTIDMFGITLPKSTYNIMMWGLVVVFGVIAIVVIGRTGSYRRDAKYRTQLYDELEEEYKNYKAKANEKEKKLARELQTERNRLDELLGRG